MLEPFFKPNGVAVIGASTNPHKLGYGIVRNLVEYRYPGPIYPVNPSAGEIMGLTCYRSILSTPDPLDLAIIIVPAHLVNEVVDQCGQRAIKHIIVVSGGFAETGEDGRILEESLLERADKYGMRVIGPNCIGTIDTHTPINTTFVVGMPEAGDIGFVSQSGAMCAVVIDWARGAGVGFSRIVSLGNQVDVSETEMLASMAADAQTQVITAYIEGVSDGRAFMKVAEQTARHKPVVIVKGGHGESGAKAVASHTGALAGSAEAYDAAFKHSGVLRAETMEELFDWARALAWQPLPDGNRVAVLSNAGGPAILAVDALEAAGLTLAPLTENTKSNLRKRLPSVSSVDNPVDILAGSGPGLYAIALDALLSDPTVDIALIIQAPQDWFLPGSLAEVIAEVAAVHNKTVLASIMGLASVDQALAILHRGHVPNFAFPERTASTLAAMISRQKWLEQEPDLPVIIDGIDQDAADAALGNSDLVGIVDAYRIALPPMRSVKDATEAVQAAGVIGYPVVMKLQSSNISHKSDVGGVALDLNNEEDVRSAFNEIVMNARKSSADVVIDGVLVQKMFKGGHELIIGVRRDPQFGPLVLVGSGGIDVELRPDVAMGIAPLSRQQAGRILDETYASKRLSGWRGSAPADREAVLDVMQRMAQIACDFPQIVEMEINPLYTMPSGMGAYALDIRGVING